MDCRSCGFQLPEEAVFCAECGQKVVKEIVTDPTDFSEPEAIEIQVTDPTDIEVSEESQIISRGILEESSPDIQVRSPKFCRKCGNQLLSGALFCPSCGNKTLPVTGSVSSPSPTNQPPSPMLPLTKAEIGSSQGQQYIQQQFAHYPSEQLQRPYPEQNQQQQYPQKNQQPYIQYPQNQYTQPQYPQYQNNQPGQNIPFQHQYGINQSPQNLNPPPQKNTPPQNRKKKSKPGFVIVSVFGLIIVAILAAYFLLPRLGINLGLPGQNGSLLSFLPQKEQPNLNKTIAVTGNAAGSGLQTTNPVQAANQVVTASGGKITIESPESNVKGMTIEIPSGAYASDTPFTVTTSEIASQGFPAELSLISPLIHIENGGGLSDTPLKVTVPCTIPEGSIPMAFYYHDDTKKLEYIPVLSYTSTSVTYATRHFSDTLLGAFDPSFAPADSVINTGFQPGTDDFSFVNNGSYIAPRGHCAGQSIAAIWYYNNLKAAKGALYGRFDDFGKKEDITLATKEFQYDDVLAYRLASMAHREIWFPVESPNWDMSIWNAIRTSDQHRYDTIKALIKLNGPQVLLIKELSGNKQVGAAHAIIAYKIEGNKIYVADPNFPGKADRFIVFENGKFKPYSSGDNAQEIAAGNGTAYNMFHAFGESALLDMGKMKTLWEELDTRTVGDSRFPKLDIKLFTKIKDTEGNEKEVEVTDGFIPSSDELIIHKLTSSQPINFDIYYCDAGGKPVLVNNTGTPAAKKFVFKLKPSDNYIGIDIYRNSGGIKAWYDYQWTKIPYGFPTLDELVGTYEDGKVNVPEVFISDAIRAEAKAKADADAQKKASGESSFLDIQGCDLEMIKMLDSLKGQTFPSKFMIEKRTGESGAIVTVDEDGKRTEIPFTYKDGTLMVEHQMPASDQTGNNDLQVKGKLTAAYGPKNSSVLIDGKMRFSTASRPDDFYIDEKLTGSKPLPPKAP